MKHLIIVFLLFILHSSCSEKSDLSMRYMTSESSPENYVTTNTIIDTSRIKFDGAIELQIYPKSETPFDDLIEIKAELHNSRPDTVYFLTSSCSGERYRLIYDSLNLEPNYLINCNGSYPVKIAIPPNSSHYFKVYFKSSSKINKVKLGFDFYEVRGDFSIEHINLNYFDNHPQSHSVVWSDETEIK